MKRMNKTVSLLLVLVMAFALTATAFAAETPTTYSITVKNAQAGETYTIYKMLDLQVNESKDAFTYTVNTNWSGFFTGDILNYVEISTSGGYVTWKTGADVVAFGKAAAAFAEDSTNSVPAIGTHTLSTTPPAEGASADKDITFSNLEPGYYLITSTNGTKVIVDTTPTDPNREIKEKNEDPTIDKKVKEGIDYGKVNDAQIGQTVEFETVIHAKSGAKEYKVHDAMDNGLTFSPSSVVIMMNNNNLTPKAATGDAATPYSDTHKTGYQYEVISGDAITDNCTTGIKCDFHIEFVQAYLDTITANTDITITYSATLNPNAVVGGNGNVNKTWLTWSKSKTEEASTTTYTWEAEVIKRSKTADGAVLEGAKFVLLNPENKVAKFGADGKITEWVALPAAGTDGKIAFESWEIDSIQTTGADGTIYIKGLDSGIQYSLREVKAPEGYNLLASDEQFQITAAKDAANVTMTQTQHTETVINLTGTMLPGTGGIGTTIFYVAGSILLIGAAVLLIVKRRMKAEQ